MADVHVLDRWSDGSARWALVDAQLAVTEETTYHLDLLDSGDLSAELPATGLIVDESAADVVVDTGAARFVLGAGGAWPLRSVDVKGEPTRDLTHCGLTIRLADGMSPRVVTSAPRLIRCGEVRAVYQAKATVTLPRERRLEVDWEVHFHAGLAVVELRVTIRNPHRARHDGGYWELGDQGSLLLEDVSLRVSLPETAGPEVTCSLDASDPLEPVGPTYHLYQDSSGGQRWNSLNHVNREGRVPTKFCGYRTSSGTRRDGQRATPFLMVRDDISTTAVATRDFWQNFPKALTVADGVLRLGLFPSEWDDVHELQGGEQKTHALALGFAWGASDLEALTAWRTPSVAVVDPVWVEHTGAVRYLTTACPDDATEIYRSLQSSAIAGRDSFEAKRERIDQYGWRHFGDIYGDHEAVHSDDASPLVSHYNNQYDPIAGLTYQFLRTGDERWWRAAREMALHVVDIDIYHTAEDKAAYNGGLFWHTVHYIDAGRATHRSYPKVPGSPGGGPASEQNYTSGLMLHYFMTGDTAARDAAAGLAEFVLQIDDGDRTVFRWLARGATGLASASGNALYHGPGRGSGNSVNACLDGYRLTGDRWFLAKAEELIRRCAHPMQDIDALTLLDAERRWYYTMFLQSLGKYLDTKVELGELDAMYDYGRQTLVHFARWMAQHERPTLEHPEQLEFPTETWAAQDIRKCDVFNDAARYADAEAAALFRERARFFFEYATSTLAQMPTHTLCRPVVVLLTSGLTHAWSLAHPATSAPPAHEQYEPRAQSPFVPQKVRALSRARTLAACVAVALVVLAVGIILTVLA